MTSIETLTRNLVEIPSHEDESEAGDFIEDWLQAETNAVVERDDHGNVFARRGGGDGGERGTIALVGHHDVVPPDESQVSDDGSYLVDLVDGRLAGRGAADMKGAVAAMMHAFRDANVGDSDRVGGASDGDDRGVSGGGDDGGVSDEGDDRASSGDGDDTQSARDGPSVDELVFVSYAGEEIGGTGARGAIADGFVPDYAVVGEGTTGYSAPGVTDVAVAHKGRRAVTIHARGVASHASEPAVGENAIYRASDAIDVVRSLSFPKTSVLGHDVRGSIAVTEISGGSAWNVIPEACTVTVDERTVPGERAPLEQLTELPGIDWTVDQDLPPMACRDDDFARRVLDAARSVHRADGTALPEHVVKPHATDAGWLADAGTTCVICGPAERGQAHTADESVSLEVLDRCYRIYRTVAEALVTTG